MCSVQSELVSRTVPDSVQGAFADETTVSGGPVFCQPVMETPAGRIAHDLVSGDVIRDGGARRVVGRISENPVPALRADTP